MEDQLLAESKVAFASCSTLRDGVLVSKSTRTLCIRGRTTFELEEQVRKYLVPDELTSPMIGTISYVVLSGPGGELRPAINIADMIQSNGAAVVVGDICASSCSQFMFIGGREKIILDGGVVAFHGGPLSDGAIDRMEIGEDGKESLKADQQRFRDFYKRHAVSMNMLTNPPEDIARDLAAGEFVMWTWSTDKLREFGVTNLHSHAN